MQDKNIDELIIAGMMTHMCVEATTRAAFGYGFKNTVLEDACATRDLVLNGKTIPAELVQTAFLAALNNSYAKIVDTESLIRG